VTPPVDARPAGGVRSGVLSFRRDLTLSDAGEDALCLDYPWGRTTLRGLAPELRAAFRLLAGPGATRDELADLVAQGDGDVETLARLYYTLERFAGQLLLCTSLLIDDVPVLRLEPIAPGAGAEPGPVAPDAPYRLSRFAFCRRLGDDWILESPAAPARVVLLGPPAAALVAELAGPRSARALAARLPGLSEAAAAACLGCLEAGGVAGPADAGGALAEDRSPVLMTWEFHDLLFHSRSRAGRHDYPIGATFGFRDTLPPLPAVKPPPPGDPIPLFAPDLAWVRAGDAPFTDVLERRQSVRAYGSEPITASQLGELLFRAARVRAVYGPLPEQELYYEASSRPYPSGGAAYDLEIYVTVGRCAGLGRGVYHYDAGGHALRPVTAEAALVDALLDVAWRSAAQTVVPQVLLTLTSRHRRLSWKYSGIAYATTLKNVGALYQTLYLVATAMGLAPCGLGSGNAALFAAATGLDYFEESAVGDFMLGSRPAGDAPRADG